MEKAIKKSTHDSKRSLKARPLGQPTKVAFFRQQLHEFLAIAAKIEETKGETLDWDLRSLGISNLAWNKIIHRGIKPIIVFPHPVVLKTISGAVRYYRMLAMVSEESMDKAGGKAVFLESEQVLPSKKAAAAIARYLNQIISRMIELDDQIDAEEFDLWRGMAAGSEVEGSWQNKSEI